MALVAGLVVTGCSPDTAADGVGGSGKPSVFPQLLAWFKPGPKPLKDCRELGKWLAGNSGQLKSKAERNAVVIEATYRPAACAACMENAEAAFEDAAYKERVAQLKYGDQFVLKVTNAQNAPDSLHLVLTDDLARRLFEIVGKDTLACTFFHAEALPSMLPYRTALLAFDRKQDGADRQLLLRDTLGRLGGDVKLIFPQGGIRSFLEVAPDSLTTIRS
ncbi:MAG: hypothetical protein KJZ58_05420 [Flavobacteriales bacterium]|nr:hypothetical protein [Flavobacteriales bacterium]